MPGLAAALEGGAPGPDDGGDAHRQQIERAEEQGLDGVAVLVGQQLPVLGSPAGVHKEEAAHGHGAGLLGPDHHLRPLIAEVAAAFGPIPEIEGRAYKILGQAPGPLAEQIEKFLHITGNGPAAPRRCRG